MLHDEKVRPRSGDRRPQPLPVDRAAADVGPAVVLGDPGRRDVLDVEGSDLAGKLRDLVGRLLAGADDPADVRLEEDAGRADEMVDGPRAVGKRLILEIVIVPGELQPLLGERARRGRSGARRSPSSPPHPPDACRRRYAARPPSRDRASAPGRRRHCGRHRARRAPYGRSGRQDRRRRAACGNRRCRRHRRRDRARRRRSRLRRAPRAGLRRVEICARYRAGTISGRSSWQTSFSEVEDQRRTPVSASKSEARLGWK